MADTLTSVAPRGNIFAGFFRSIFNTLVMIAESDHRMKAVEKLTAMSDAELAERGLKRADIVRHVFRDSLYV
ncbi:hypothetical protein ANTHELSMS3_00451 [Antarctobacter heliothermus]|uniref:DUF1127 domain-containing protein n=1 Tax=Antarctobacter heliothermus TaxID=74033 RepID=A0A222DZP2_9RHOB|nr:DUF1127 domain-containing protein [Antarctobacter heliothermus]ASP19171.1 hypothetical protein ANTHELSMS3_00451 [Antarctobacter heliothermus]MBT54017.1 DUF1127 domain-containing protein [Mameliella sp.]|tara:strand:+ start:1956 stop:2171 length:216 start_codon:yes stop_codon:yes gene_type:complete